MGSCKDYFTRFNLGTFPRKISVEEAEKRYFIIILFSLSKSINFIILSEKCMLFQLNLITKFFNSFKDGIIAWSL